MVGNLPEVVADEDLRARGLARGKLDVLEALDPVELLGDLPRPVLELGVIRDLGRLERRLPSRHRLLVGLTR